MATAESEAVERQTRTVAEVASKLGASEALICQAIAEGRIRAFKVGRRKWLIPVAELDRLLSAD